LGPAPDQHGGPGDHIDAAFTGATLNSGLLPASRRFENVYPDTFSAMIISFTAELLYTFKSDLK
jgi:hypothetical protein